jgi:DNA-binding PadR family transcriptional regulator
MASLDSDARALLPLTPAVFHILLAVADGDRHGLGIMADVEERTEGAVKLGPGTLYGTIKRMMAAALLQETDARPAPEEDDPRRRYYAITALGRRAAELEAERLATLLGIAREKKVFPRATTR